MDVKAKTFGTNTTTMFNESTRVHQYDEHVKLIASRKTPINAVPQTATSIDLVTRFTFDLTNYSDWIIQVELVKSLTNPLEFATKLPTAKELLVDVDLEKMNPSAYDYVSTSLVRIEPGSTTQAEVSDLINEIDSIESIGATGANHYQEALHSLAKDIFRDAMTISQFKHKSGFKRLCANTVELSRPIYFKQVLPDIDTFYMTDKMDGVRAMLIIDEVYRRSGHRRIYLGANITAVSDQIYDIASFKKPSGSKTIETDHTVLDVEMMTDGKGKHTFYCFDVIAFASKRLANLPFKERFAKFADVDTLMTKHEIGSVKEFVTLTKDSFAKQIQDFYKKKRSYHIDGLIFTPQGVYYKEAVKMKKNKFDRVFNTDYATTISFKWKPLDQLTIDFYLMTHPTKKGTYILCSGVDSKTFDRLQMEFFSGYVAPPSPNAARYFPIQFEPYNGDFDYVWSPSKEDLSMCAADPECKSLDGMVGEFVFADGSKRLERPKLLRLRTDRVHDIAKGEYYGNALRYSELIWHSIQYPLTIESMCEPTDAGYFAANDSNDWFKAQRNFNSFVKTHILETYLYPKTKGPARIMDFAGGRGQDIGRAIDCGFNEVVLIDQDVDALYEALERKYNLRVKRKGATSNIHVKKANLEEDAMTTIKHLKLPEASADAATINFALHYLCHSAGPNQPDPIEQFVKVCAFYLKPGARLSITTFNGKDIFDILGTKNDWSVRENGQMKYSIKREFSSDTLTDKDQKIGVLLPFSAGQYYSEYLVNYEYLQGVFEANGFKLVRTDSFGSLLRAYKKSNRIGYNAMTTADQEYVALYSYLIVERL